MSIAIPRSVRQISTAMPVVRRLLLAWLLVLFLLALVGGLLRLLPARLLGDPDQHVRRGAKLLQLHVAEAEPTQRGAHLGKIGRPALRLHLDHGAADEVDAEIQPVGEEQHDREDRKSRGDWEADATKAREIEMRVVWDDAQRRQEIEHRDHGQHDNQNAKPNENVLSHEPDS